MKKTLLITLLLCSAFLFAQDSPGIYTIRNAKINTTSSDFGTAFMGDDKIVFAAPKEGFTMSREEESREPFLDLYMGIVTEDGQVIRKQKLPGEINTKFHEGMVTFSKDLKTVYFSANGKIKRVKRKRNKDREFKTKQTANIQLFKATIDENGNWGNLEMLPFNSDDFSTGHPVLNRDGTKLYFVSDRPETLGKTDIFYVDVLADGSYGDPVNLGPDINTPEREMFPFIGEDNVLYFSSDGYPGYGELDVYASKIFDNTVSKPMNLGAPVNSDKDDFAYIIDDRKHKGYFSSNRAGGKGDDDIYAFTASPPLSIECQQEISGVVRNLDTQELIPNVTIMLFDEQGEKLQTFMSSSQDASFSFSQSCNTTYKLKGYLEGFLIGEMDIKTVNDLNADPIEIVMHMEKDPSKDMNLIVATATSSDSEQATSFEEDSLTGVGANANSTETREETYAAGMAMDDDEVTEIAEVTEAAQSESVEESSEPKEAAEVAVAAESSDKDATSFEEDSLTGVGANANSTETREETYAAGMAMNDEEEAKPVTVYDQVEIVESNEYQINTIYFDFDKYNIRYDARIEMDKLVKLLQEHPQMKIEVNSHTDIRGSEKYNALLAERRAKQTMKYLLDKGIRSERVTGKGFGELQVAEPCASQKPCTELQHQLNRRSEFLIFKPGVDGVAFRSNNRRSIAGASDNVYTANSGKYTNYNFYDDQVVVYTVQIGAFKGKVQTAKYSQLTTLFNHRYHDGLDRYYSGVFETSSEAREHLQAMKKKGFPDAFVVKLKGEKRL